MGKCDYTTGIRVVIAHQGARGMNRRPGIEFLASPPWCIRYIGAAVGAVYGRALPELRRPELWPELWVELWPQALGRFCLLEYLPAGGTVEQLEALLAWPQHRWQPRSSGRCATSVARRAAGADEPRMELGRTVDTLERLGLSEAGDRPKSVAATRTDGSVADREGSSPSQSA